MRNTLLWIACALCMGCASEQRVVRFATFNASLNRDKPGQLAADLSTGKDAQIRNVAEVIQRVNPDVLLINEFDFDPSGKTVEMFQANYLSIPQNGAKPVEYPYVYSGPVNTGVSAARDFDNNGRTVTEPGSRDYGGDCFGFGLFPGQYGMVLLSKYPIRVNEVRSFQTFLWKDMPGAMLPVDASGAPWYSADELAVFRLSSKNHWDVPVDIHGTIVHVLCSHPTPPAFDGPEDRNGKRNHDEIRMFADYITGGQACGYLVDDTGKRGRDSSSISFVLMGDLNADPLDGGSVPGAIDQLLKHPAVDSVYVPTSAGAAESTQLQRGKNNSHRSDPRADTADFSDGDNGPGNLRCDYVLHSKDLPVAGGNVFWPAAEDPLSRLMNMQPVATSDHRLVYLDLTIGSR